MREIITRLPECGRRRDRALRGSRRQVHGRRRARLFRLAARRMRTRPSGRSAPASPSVAAVAALPPPWRSAGRARRHRHRPGRRRRSGRRRRGAGGGGVGDTPNLAARLQDAGRARTGRRSPTATQTARPATCSSSSTSATQPLKGFDEPIAASPSRRRARDRRAASRHATAGALRPMVGRDQELGLLLRALGAGAERRGPGASCSWARRASASRGSREALREQVGAADSASPLLSMLALPYHSALYPIIQQLDRAAEFDRDPPATPARQARDCLGRHATPYRDGGAADRDPAGRAPRRSLRSAQISRPRRSKARTSRLWSTISRASAAARRSWCSIEDLHWIDPSTLEFVHLVLGRIEQPAHPAPADEPPGRPPSWRAIRTSRGSCLNRLGRAAVEAMTAAIEGSETLPDAVRSEILPGPTACRCSSRS